MRACFLEVCGNLGASVGTKLYIRISRLLLELIIKLNIQDLKQTTSGLLPTILCHVASVNLRLHMLGLSVWNPSCS